jgi:hypothetical protein
VFLVMARVAKTPQPWIGERRFSIMGTTSVQKKTGGREPFSPVRRVPRAGAYQ